MRSIPFLKKFDCSVLRGCGVNPVVEYFFHTFSLLIPKGEGFFMRSVRVAATIQLAAQPQTHKNQCLFQSHGLLWTVLSTRR